MSYRVNGNVVIDNSGNALLTNIPIVQKPTNLSPTGGNTAYGVTLEMSDYRGLYEATIPRKFAQYQVANLISFADGNIVYDSGNIDGAPNSNVTITLTTSETYYWRGRYSNNNNVFSEFSDASEFVYGGAIAPPTALGAAYEGGYFIGNVDIGGGVCYYLVVAPNAEGCVFGCQWKTTFTTTGGTTSANGFANTYNVLANGSHPAGNWTATRTIGGYTDWYLPGLTELTTMYQNKGSLPAGEGFYTAPDGPLYWSSTERNTSFARVESFNQATTPYGYGKTCTNIKLRATRRVPIS